MITPATRAWCGMSGALAVLLLGHVACQQPPRHPTGGRELQSATTASVPEPEAISLLGRPLFAPMLPADENARRERELEKAQGDYDRNLHDEDAIIWYGRRLAYLGRYRQAIDVYSNGLAIHPDSYKLLRHRGHRYITTRQFHRAVADLQRAESLIRDRPDEIEPDGQPNRLNIPTSTAHTNIYYHLGLVHYLRGAFDEACAAFQKCVDAATNDDMRVAAAYWLYLGLRRTDHDNEAEAVLEQINPAMNIIENSSYHRLLLMFKGDVSENEVAAGNDGVSPFGPDIDRATIGYGVAVASLLKGEAEKARRGFQTVVDNSNWAAFGAIAAEAELARP